MVEKLAPGELTHVATRGAFWNIGLAFANKGFTLVGQLVLAWILSPKDMGLAGMATAMAGIVAFMNANGVCDVLIQRGRYKEEAGQGLWLSFFLSLCTAVLIACLVPIALWMGRPELSKMLLILSFLPIADALTPILAAALKSELNFKHFAISYFWGGISYTLFAVFFAFMGLGAYSLILPVIPRALITGTSMLFKTKFPRFEKPKFDFIKTLIRPSLSISSTSFLTSLQQQAPIFCVGLVTDFTVTGHFSWGWQVASQSVFLLAVNLRQVLMPTLSKISHDPERQALAMFRAIRAITALLTIACGLQALLAQPLLIKISPLKWSPSGPVIAWISLGLIFQGVYVCLSSWLNAAGKYRELLTITILPVVLASAGAYLGAVNMGSEGAALGTALGLFLSSVISFKVIPFSVLKEQVFRFALPLSISLLTWSVLYWLNALNNNNLYRAFIYSAIFLSVSALSWWHWSREMFKNILENIFSKNTFKNKSFFSAETDKKNLVPNFFIIGAPKCGTTSLSEYLSYHPNIYMSRIKEPQFFNKDIAKHSKINFKTYLSLFADVDPKVHRVVGEGSTAYLFSKCAIKEIMDFNPKSKFVAILRNPVELLQALHFEMMFQGIEDIKDFEQAWRAEEDRKSGKRIPFFCFEPQSVFYSELGKLGDQVERFMSVAPKENIKIILFEDFVSDVQKYYNEVLSFLDLPSDHRSDFPKLNESKVPKWGLLHFPILTFVKFERFLVSEFGIVDKHDLGRKLLVLNSKQQRRKEISKEFKLELINFFREDINKLSKLLNRDLNHWLSH